MTRIRSASLYLPNPEPVAEWYRSLGYAVRKRGMVFHVAAGYSDLRLIPGEEGAFFPIAFHVRGEAFDRVLHSLKQTIEFLPTSEDGNILQEFPAWSARSVYAHDPAGNIVEWITRPDHIWQGLERPTPDIPGLAEIGVPVPDMVPSREKAALYLPVFDQYDDRFAAIGDPEALVIMVPEGHGWLPTGRPARFFPCSAVFEHMGQRVMFHTQENGIVWSR